MEYKEYKKIPMCRPEKDHFFSNGSTCSKESYDKAIKSERIKELLKSNSLFITYDNLYEATKDTSNKMNAVTIDPADPTVIGHITSIDMDHYTCDIAIRDNDFGLLARKYLEDKENIFCLIGVSALGDISKTKEKTYDIISIGYFHLMPADRKNKDIYDYYKLDNYPVEGTYYDPNNN